MSESHNITQKVTVIVPVYNAAKYLGDCLDSIVSQTHDNLEIIIIDDGSKDTSSKIYNEYVNRDQRVKVICQKNAGAAKARNSGLDMATGEYIQFIDSDDVVDLRMIEKQLIQCENSDADISICRYDTFMDSSERIIMREPTEAIDTHDKDSIADRIFTLTSPSIWKMLFRRDFIERNQLRFDPTLVRSEDLLFGAQSLALAAKVTIINEHLYHYRTGVVDSVMSNREPRYLTTFLALRKLKQFLESKRLYAKYREGFVRLAFGGALLYDYESKDRLFVEHYGELHEFATGISMKESELMGDNYEIDKDTALMIMHKNPIDFFVDKLAENNEQLQRTHKELEQLQGEHELLRKELSKKETELARASSEIDELRHVRESASLLFTNLKRALRDTIKR